MLQGMSQIGSHAIKYPLLEEFKNPRTQIEEHRHAQLSGSCEPIGAAESNDYADACCNHLDGRIEPQIFVAPQPGHIPVNDG